MTDNESAPSVPDTPSQSEAVTDVPEDVFTSISADSQKAGGPFVSPPDDEGSVGRTMFDMPSSRDGTVTVLLPPESIDSLPSQALVRIESRGDHRTYLGAVVEGPFAEPNGLRADATPMVVATVQGGLLMPKHHGRVQIALIGEQLETGTIVPPRRRPKPNSPVFPLNEEETTSVLRIRGSLRLGLAEGFDDLPVSVPADSKGVFPRHLGILGTTGAGKSTTVSSMVLKAQQEGMAVILIDTEGEYCHIHEPTEDETMLEALERRGLDPAGVPVSHVYHLLGRETANPQHPSLHRFSLRFCELSPYAVQEILELNEAQRDRFIKAYDVAKSALEKFGIWPTNDAEKSQLLELDELETGYPNMTLTHLYDVVKEVAYVIEKDGREPYLETRQFLANRQRLHQIIQEASPPKVISSWRALIGRISKIKRLGIFDTREAPSLNYTGLLQEGRVSILDLSDTDSPHINNLVIAELLRGIQVQQERNYTEAVKENRNPVPAAIFIEEAHEFLSANRISQMPVLYQQVARIARRGRKRWLGLVFITQLPQHLPDEVLGLINNWILHKIGDSNVINRLRRSIGGIDESLWRFLPSLAPGQAIVSFTTLARPLQVSIDPTPCKLTMVE